jgi:hypothetical protein
MPTAESATPIWRVPQFQRFFDRADETIAESRRLLDHPWLGEREQWLHHVILEICGAEQEALVG